MNNKKTKWILLCLFSVNTVLPDSNELLIRLSPKTAEDVVKILKESSGQINENTSGFFKALGEALPHVNPGLISVGKGTADAMKPIGRELLKNTAISLGLIAGFTIMSVAAQEIIKKYILRYMFEPALVEKRSSSSIVQRLQSLFKDPENVALQDHMVIDDRLTDNLNYIMNMTKNIKKNGGQFEHVLLHGLPGTGKTLFAQLLAEHCGMSYAFVPAANVSQFLANGTAVQELNELFIWAARNGNGTILFFDEAENFLADRATLNRQAQDALAAFLAKTGTPSDKIMIICATNRPQIIDNAVLNRLSFKVEFPLPNLNAREAQLVMHIKNTFEKQKGAQVSYDCLQNSTYLTHIAEQLDGCSGRTIQKAVNRFRQVALAQDVLQVSDDIVTQVVNQMKADQTFVKIA